MPTAGVAPAASMLPYELNTPDAFSFIEINGRALTDDVIDVNLTQASNVPTADGVLPDRTKVRPDFPDFGAPYSAAEQIGALRRLGTRNARLRTSVASQCL